MKFPKLHLPRIKLSSLLRAILVAVILVEILILYKAFYLDAKQRSLVESPIERSSVEIDRVAANKARNWFLLRELFVAPPEYELSGTEFGRENPFVQF